MTPDVLAKQLLTIFTGRSDDYLRDGKRAYKPLDEKALIRHLSGTERVGVYPNGNTGWMCFDFDGKNIPGNGAATAFQQVLQVRQALGCGLIELSRSGKGYHLWVFFDFPWPTVTDTKKLGKAVLSACSLPTDEKESAGHPGIYPHPPKAKEVGGQEIGKTPFLPLYGFSGGNQTSLFLDVLGQPYPDQLAALGDLGRIGFADLLARFPIVAASFKGGSIVRENQKPRHDIARDLAMTLRNFVPQNATRLLVRAVAKNMGMFAEGREGEVETAITSAYAKPAIQVKTQFDIEQEIGPSIYEIRETPLKEIKNMKETELDYLVEGLILPEEGILIASPPGAGKSMLSMSLALSAAAGKPVFGQYDLLEPLRVLYVNEEMSDREFSKRMNKLANGMGVNLEDIEENLLVFPQQGLVLHPKNAAALTTFKERCLAFKPNIVILDTFIALFGGEEKDSGEVRHWYNSVVVWLRKNVGCAVIVQHHIKKPPEDFNFRTIDDTSLLYLIRGSSDLPGAFERVLVLWKFGDNATSFGRLVNISIRNPKARSGDKIDPFDMVVDDVTLDSTTVVATRGNKSPHAGQNDARVLHILAQNGGKMLKSDLLTYLQGEGGASSDRTARRWLQGAMKRQICRLFGDHILRNGGNSSY